MATNSFEQMERLVGFIHALDSGGMEKIYEAVAQSISAKGSKDIAEAVRELGEVNAAKYLPASRDYLRNAREEAKLRREEEMADLLHQKAKEELELELERQRAENRQLIDQLSGRNKRQHQAPKPQPPQQPQQVQQPQQA